MNLRKAKEQELIKVEEMYVKLITEMDKTENYPRWKIGVYPSKETLMRAFENEWLYILTDENSIMGSVVLNTESTTNFDYIKWNIDPPEDRILNIHTLAVAHELSGKGVGSKFIDEIKKYAKKNEYQAIRLDVFSKNIPAEKLYKKNGFIYIDKIDIGNAIYDDLGLKDVDIFKLYEYVI